MNIVISNTLIGKELVPTCNLRDLHEQLGVSTRFNDWIKARIEQYGFMQGVDFITILDSQYSPPRLEYHGTIDMAKELSMVEKTEKGKQARQYFIECERKSREIIPRTFSQALRLAAEKQEEVERQQALLEYQKEFVLLAKAVIAEDRLLSISEAAKEFDFKQKEFFDFLFKMKWIFKREQYDKVKKENPWLATAQMMHKGYLVVKERPDSRGRMRIQTMVTPEGMKKLASIIKDE